MTEIVAAAEGGRFSLSAEGHATGSEAVCAAVSGLFFALGGYALNAARDGLGRIGCLRLESGSAELTFSGGERMEAAFDMAVLGLRQIERSYPDVVHVKILEKFPDL